MTTNRLIRAIAFVALLVGACLLSLPFLALRAHASDAGTCYTIGDADARAFCLAKARKDPGMCYSIQRQDLRAQCRAEVR